MEQKINNKDDAQWTSSAVAVGRIVLTHRVPCGQGTLWVRACKVSRFEHHTCSPKSDIACQSFVLDLGDTRANLNLYPYAALNPTYEGLRPA